MKETANLLQTTAFTAMRGASRRNLGVKLESNVYLNNLNHTGKINYYNLKDGRTKIEFKGEGNLEVIFGKNKKPEEILYTHMVYQKGSKKNNVEGCRSIHITKNSARMETTTYKIDGVAPERIGYWELTQGEHGLQIKAELPKFESGIFGINPYFDKTVYINDADGLLKSKLGREEMKALRQNGFDLQYLTVMDVLKGKRTGLGELAKIATHFGSYSISSLGLLMGMATQSGGQLERLSIPVFFLSLYELLKYVGNLGSYTQGAEISQEKFAIQHRSLGLLTQTVIKNLTLPISNAIRGTRVTIGDLQALFA